MKTIELRLKKRSILYFFASLLAIEPTYFAGIGWLDNTIYNYGIPLLFIVLLILTIKRKYINKFLVLSFVFYFLIGLSTVLYSGSISSLFINFLTIGSIAFLVNYGCRRDGLMFCKCMGTVFFIYAIINLSIVFLSGDIISSIYNSVNYQWFLGHRNGLIKILLPGVAFVCLPDIVQHNRLKLSSWIYIILMCITIIIGFSSTSIIALALFGLCIFADLKEWKIARIASPLFAIGINIVFFILFVVLRVQYMFSNLIVGIFGKTLEFTGRTYLWDRLLLSIVKHPILGQGIQSSQTMQALLNYSNSSSHNLMLDYLYQGGILCLAVFFMLVILSAKKSIKNADSHVSTKAYVFVCSSLVGLSIVWNTDTFSGTNLTTTIALLGLLFNLEYCNIKVIRRGDNDTI